LFIAASKDMSVKKKEDSWKNHCPRPEAVHAGPKSKKAPAS